MKGGGLVGMRGCVGVEERRFRPLVGLPSTISQTCTLKDSG